MSIEKHRGPDDEGTFFEKNIGLGFVRLSILDLTYAGHQPMISNDTRYVTVFNGEVYNYLELRDELKQLNYIFKSGTDTEVILAAYKEWGEDCLSHFNGMWALAVYDRINRTLFAARDRFGIKPFYYLQTKDFFAFASEIPPLLSLLKDKIEPDYQSIFDYLAFNRTDQTERTFFKEIKKLQHGCKLLINSGEVIINKWYDLKQNLQKSEGFKSSDEFFNSFQSSIKLRLRSDVPVGVCLSGGLDSSSIVSTLLKCFKKKDLRTFSAVYEKGQFGDESEFIAEYRNSGCEMFYTTPTAVDLLRDLDNFITAHAEPIPSTSPYAQFKVMELAKGKVVVTLDGQGADEELAGYHYFYGVYFIDLLRKFHLIRFSKEILKYTIKHKSLYGIKSLVFFLLPRKLRTRTKVLEKGYINKEFVNNYSSTNKISGNLYGSKALNEALIDHFEYKLEHLLKWEDRNSMWFSLEARVPFLDYTLVEKLLATRGDLIIKNGMTKNILREGMRNILPEKIRSRRDKIGFGTPQSEWFRTVEWRTKIYEIIESDSFKQRNIINHEIALKKYKSHLLGKIDISSEIWKWLHLELWFRKYID